MKKRNHIFRKYSALILAAILAVCACAPVYASDEGVQESERVTLNIAGASDAEETAEDTAEEMAAETEAETAAEETEAETEPETEPETEAETEPAEPAEPIASVADSSGSIVTTDVSEIVENCMPSIVAITNVSVEEVESYYYGTMEFEEESTASGIIISQTDEELLIATNDHVVSDAKELTVCFSVEAEEEEDLIVPAKLKGSDSGSELAVIAVQMSDIKQSVRDQLRIAKLGSSDNLKVGQAAIAIGNALGYGQSVTVGIISALNRPLTIDSFSMDVILTDAAINFGNSGSALLNDAGEVIGICVAKETGDGAEGMGYAIPIDTAIPVLEQLINKETRDKLSDAKRGYIGATVMDVSEEAVQNYGMPAGAFVYEVAADSAAEEAGLKNGDIITKLEGETVTGSSDLIDKMSYYGPGETVTLEVMTANDGTYVSRDVEITLRQGENYDEEETEEEEDEEDESLPEEDESYDEDFFYDDGWYDDDFFEFDDGFSDGFEDYNRQFH